MGGRKGQYLIGFDELFRAHIWREIRNCPGRYVLAGGPVKTTVDELLGEEAVSSKFEVENARDPVLVTRLREGCGLISYIQRDGSYIHTLNDGSGFTRKLADLGIAEEVLSAESEC
ncbi:MAG TPA: hypothetical protein VKM94_21060 [Blastocatellia bacterium]|nr:hypothetical protein [Blastocatellia bacterium]